MMEEGEQSSAERVFYGLLVRVGALGKYQHISIVIWSLVYLLSSSVLYINPFLFYQAPYTCSGLTEDECTSMVCSLPLELRTPYNQVEHPSLLDKFGDYRCDGNKTGNVLQSIIYISGLLGVLLATFLSSFIRKKVLIQISLVTSLLCFLMMMVVEHLTLMVILLCFNLAAQTIISDLAICFVVESVLESERDGHMMILFVFYNAAVMFNGLLFKYLSWQAIFVLYYIIPLILTIIGLQCYVKETPFDLVTCFTPEEAYEQFDWIAQQNGNTESHGITVEELRVMKRDYEESLKRHDKQEVHLLDLFRFKSLRLNTICCCIMHFFCYYNISAPLLALDQFSNNIYDNDILFGAATLITSIGCYYFIEDLPRRKMIIFTAIPSLIFILPNYLSAVCKDECQTITTIETFSMFIFRILNEISYQAFYLIQNELFPTQVRPIAILLTAVLANLTPIAIPLIGELNKTAPFVLPLTFLVSGIILVAVTCFIRQTLNVPPPEIIPELAYKPTPAQ